MKGDQEVSTDEGEENPPNFPSIDIALEEARNRFSYESERRRSVESKTSIVIGINALLISAVASLLQVHPVTLTLIIIPALVSTVFGLSILEIDNYADPGKDIEEFYQYARQEEENLQDELLISYINAVEHNEVKNNDKISKFVWSYTITASSILMVAASPGLDYSIRAIITLYF